MHKYAVLAALLSIAVAGAMPVRADLITLRSGQTLDGTLERKGATMLIHQASGGTISVPADEVVSVTLKSSQPPAEQAASGLDFLHKQAARATTLASIITQYERFIEQYPDTPAQKQAEKELADYQRMAQEKYVKLGGHWTSPADAEPLLAKAQEAAEQAYKYYRAGQLDDAQTSVQAALAIQSDNTLALLTAGLTDYQLNKLNDARARFTEITVADPHNAIAWNNNAVVLFQQNRQPEALQDYLKALAAAPESRVLLDNVTQALHSYTGPKTAKLFMDATRLYNQYETKLEARMAQQGLYRVGNTWATADERSQLSTRLAQLKSTADALQQQYTDALATVRATQQELATLQDQYNQAVDDYNTSWVVTSMNGNVYWDPYWFERRTSAMATINQILQRRTQLQESLQRAQAQIAQAKQSAAGLKGSYENLQGEPFTGVQLLMQPGDLKNPPPPPPLALPASAAAASQPTPPLVINVNPGQSRPLTPTTPFQPQPSPWVYLPPPAFGQQDPPPPRDPPKQPPTTQPGTQPTTRPLYKPL